MFRLVITLGLLVGVFYLYLIYKLLLDNKEHPSKNDFRKHDIPR